MTLYGEQMDKLTKALEQCRKEAQACNMLMFNPDLMLYEDMLKNTVGKLQTIKRLTKELAKLRTHIESQYGHEPEKLTNAENLDAVSTQHPEMHFL